MSPFRTRWGGSTITCTSSVWPGPKRVRWNRSASRTTIRSRANRPRYRAGRSPITRYFSRPATAVPYEYDFGDGWEHELTLEAILPRQPGQKYPLCIDGARACPPEDCGGVYGYENLLTVLQDPTNEEHQSMIEWLGGRFDPDRFDASRVKFDDPARRYKLAFEASRAPVPRGRRTTKPRRKRSRRNTG
jgi:pRiA4b ORF-3-like protein